MDFNQCVGKDHKACRFIQDEDLLTNTDHRGQMSQFCGHSEICRKFNNPQALQLAKENVQKFYPVVGVMELMNETLAVLEKKLPHFFANASQRYDINFQHHNNRNKMKKPTAKEILEKIKPKFSHEYEFYQFCKQRLLQQYQDIRQ